MPSRCLAIGLLASLLLAACLPGKKRLDEYVFHDEAGLRLKIVRYYENLPFHYDGEIFVVMCQSEATREFPAHPTQDAGWRMLARGGAIGSESARALLPTLQPRYRVLPGPTLVWLGRALQVSFDGCGRVATWDPTGLPAERIDPAPKPDFCAPKGTGDCRAMDFEGDRAPDYREIQVDAERGQIGFSVSSSAFRPAPALHVESSDAGQSWSLRP